MEGDLIPSDPPPRDLHIYPQNDVVSLPAPPLDPDMFNDAVSVPVDFAADMNFDEDDVVFDFSSDDLAFADDLLLEPFPDPPGSDPRSDLNQKNPSPNSNANLSPNWRSISREIGDFEANLDDRGLNFDVNQSFNGARVCNYSSADSVSREIGDFEANLDDRCLNNAGGSNVDANQISNGARVCNHSSQDSVSREIGDFEANLEDRGLIDAGGLNFDANQRSDGIKVCNYSSQESDNGDRDSFGNVSSEESGDHHLNYRSAKSNFNQKLNCPSPECGESNSGVSHVVSSPEPYSGHDSNNNRELLGSLRNSTPEHENSVIDNVVENNVKFEDGFIKCIQKRKKEEENGNNETRTSKLRKSSFVALEREAILNVESEEDEKRKVRLIRNRESAQLSRQRKKQYVEELEDKVKSMHSTITELNGKISYIMAENANLRQQLSGASACPPPPPSMYPMAPPMAYPWMPCAPYMVKPQGSQVPLVPIPRLKSQQPVTALKVNKKPESKTGKGRTKKVASISFLGLLFFFLLFGGLVPVVNVRFGGIGGVVNVSNRLSNHQKGRILMIDRHLNGTGYHEGMRFVDGRFANGSQIQPGSEGFVPPGNSSEPLVASLYVPRNDKMVKIDGNLIIHSVLASEKTLASHTTKEPKASEETRLVIATSYAPPYPIPGAGENNRRHPHHDRDPKGSQRALGSGSVDELESVTIDGQPQQWFREGLAGPMLSSGMCTEVFQFDISPTPGAIIPATAVTNTTERRHNSTNLNKTKNRRILHALQIPLNAAEERMGRNPETDGLRSNKTQSSMVVSVLVDPREVGDGDGEGLIRSKTLSRIFVVVLIDSVKYVTYSCMLPFMGSGSHLVTK